MTVTIEHSIIVTPEGITATVPKPKRTVFNSTTDAVSWARWTWNPVTGCRHGCTFCYARAIAGQTKMQPYYPLAFEPAFHADRLAAPLNTPRPRSTDPRAGRVFVCSMADLFGKWVPDAWIEQVFTAAMAAPDWEYLFLTKWPARYSMLASLPKAWFGASVIKQADVRRVESNMAGFQTTGIKWLSLEPMLEPIRFSDLSWCDLMVIGAQSATKQPDADVPAFTPPWEWVADVIRQCEQAGVPVYLKENLTKALPPGMPLVQMMPRVGGA